MNKAKILRIFLILSWGLSGMFAGLMLSLLFLICLQVKGILLYLTIGLAVVSAVAASAVRKIALWYIARKGEE